MSGLDVLVVFVGIILVRVVIHGLSRRLARRDRFDPALVIPPPRQYVDADGRADYRPELQERHIERRY